MSERASLSRRAVAAALTLVPVVAVSAAAVSAVSAHHARTPDPVFDAIARERVAYAAWTAAGDAEEAALDEWRKVAHDFPDFIEVQPGGLLAKDGGSMLAHTCKDHREIERHFEHWDCLPAFHASLHKIDEADLRKRFEARRVAAHKLLRERLKRHADERQRFGIPKLAEEAKAAFSAWTASERAVLATVPSTPTGVLALLSFARDYIDNGADGEDVRPLLASLEAFIGGGANA